MTTQRFHTLATLGGEYDEDRVFLEKFIQGIEAKSWCTHRGVALTPFYPKDARIYMTPSFPQMKLTSLISNDNSMLMVTAPFKELIEKHCPKAEIEYLPFTIYDHRKRVHGRDYFLINPIGTFDCLDVKATRITWSKKEPEKAIHVAGHALDRKKMKGAPQLFRMTHDSPTYVVGEKLAKDIVKAEFTNVGLTALRYSDEPEEEDGF